MRLAGGGRFGMLATMTNRTHNPRLARFTAQLLGYMEILGLAVIAIATLVAGGQQVFEMIATRTVTLADLLGAALVQGDGWVLTRARGRVGSQ